MKRIHLILSVVWSCFFMVSCINDVGNEDYLDENDVFPVQISSIGEDIEIRQGERLVITPSIAGLSNPQDYEYSWFVTDITSSSNFVAKRFDISNSKDLDYEVKLDVGKWRLHFEVIDPKRDVFRRIQTNLTVTATPITQGWFVLKENGEGKTDFDYIGNNGSQYNDCLGAGGNALEGSPVGMVFQSFGYTFQTFDDEGNSILQKEQMCYHIVSNKEMRTFNAQTMQQFYDFDNVFYQKPETWNPQDIVICPYTASYLVNDNRVFTYGTGFTTNIGKYGADKVGHYKLFPKLLNAIYMNAYGWDMLTGEFYVIGSTNVPSLTTTTRLSALRIPNTDEMIELLPELSQLLGQAAMAITRTTSGEYMLSQVSFTSSMYSVTSYLPIDKGSKLISAIESKSSVMCAPENGNYIYFTSGNQIYGYVNAEGLSNKERLVAQVPSGETVSVMKAITTTDGAVVAILTNKADGWTLRLYPLVGQGNPELGSEPVKTWHGSGKGKFLMFRDS